MSINLYFSSLTSYLIQLLFCQAVSQYEYSTDHAEKELIKYALQKWNINGTSKVTKNTRVDDLCEKVNVLLKKIDCS